MGYKESTPMIVDGLQYENKMSPKGLCNFLALLHYLIFFPKISSQYLPWVPSVLVPSYNVIHSLVLVPWLHLLVINIKDMSQVLYLTTNTKMTHVIMRWDFKLKI